MADGAQQLTAEASEERFRAAKDARFFFLIRVIPRAKTSTGSLFSWIIPGSLTDKTERN
jgi:hypothetical protein